MKKRTILVTGANGFLGRYITECFGSSGWTVVGLDRFWENIQTQGPSLRQTNYVLNDLSNTDDVRRILDVHCPDAIIHLAGPANVQASFNEPQADFAAQTIPLMNLLEAVRQTGTNSSVLLVSSAAVYGNPESLPISEKHRIKPISPYGFHKYFQEMILKEYRQLFGVNIRIARVFSTFGPGLRQLAVWDIARRALHGDYTVYGTGEETRDYLFVADIALAIKCIIETPCLDDEIINVASGTETTISSLSELIYKELDIKAKPIIDNNCRTGYPIRWCADISCLSRLGFKPSTSIKNGIGITMEWIKRNV